MSIFDIVIKFVDKQYFRVLQTNYLGTIPCPVLGIFNLIVLVAAVLCMARADENLLEQRKDHNNFILVVLNKTNFLIETSYKLSIYFLATPLILLAKTITIFFTIVQKQAWKSLLI